jgi:hypothetical protein
VYYKPLNLWPVHIVRHPTHAAYNISTYPYDGENSVLTPPRVGAEDKRGWGSVPLFPEKFGEAVHRHFYLLHQVLTLLTTLRDSSHTRDEGILVTTLPTVLGKRIWLLEEL